jgi:DNA polymerase-3 subunit epsilon
MNFVSLDFETATNYGSSACAIGIGIFEDDLLVDKYYRLIQPPLNEYLAMNVRIHGIHPDMTENEPDFACLWDEIRPLLEGKLVLAHCASFDIGVLRKTLDYHALEHPEFNYACTCQIAKKAWPTLPGHSLDKVARHLCITFQHHNALEDAVACGMIALEAGRTKGFSAVSPLLENLKVKQNAFLPRKSPASG